MNSRALTLALLLVLSTLANALAPTIPSALEESTAPHFSGGTVDCGTNASNVSFEVEAYQPTWNNLDTVSVYLDTYCGIWNNSYMVSWGLIDDANGSIIDYGSTSFQTNTSSVTYHPNHTDHFNEVDIHLSYMQTGNYSVFGHFSVWMNNSWSFLANVSNTFEVNSTMTTTACGYNNTLVSMETDVSSNYYFEGASMYPWSDIECAMMNTPYTYTWELYNHNTSNITHSGFQNFTATWQNVNMFYDGSGFFYDIYPQIHSLTEGIYTFSTMLSLSNGTYVDHSNLSVQVWANTTGGGGNQSSGPSCAVYAWSDSYAYYVGDNFTGEVDSYCSLTNETLMIEWSILNTDTNTTVDAGNISWTSTMYSETQNVSSSALANQNAGNYSFEVILSWYNSSSTMWEMLDSDNDAFSVWNGSSGGGGNQSTGPQCSVYAWSSVYVYDEGENFTGEVDSYCSLTNETMTVYWFITNTDTNMTVDSGNITWTNTQFSTTHNVTSTALATQSPGNYSFDVTMGWVNASYWETLDTDDDPFFIWNGSTGGGGNQSGNQTDIDGVVMASTSESNYASGDTVSWFIESSELVMGEDYHIEWAVVEVMTNTTMATGNASWTAYNNMSGEQGNLSGLSDGTYCLDASLYQQVDTYAYWVDYDYACFNVGNNSSGNHSDAFYDLDFDYDITQIDNDTIGLSYTVNNSGNWSGNFYYQAYLLPGNLLINQVYGNVSINGMGVYSDSTTFDIMGLTDGAEVCVEMMFVDTNGNTEAEGEDCLVISIDDDTNGTETTQLNCSELDQSGIDGDILIFNVSTYYDEEDTVLAYIDVCWTPTNVSMWYTVSLNHSLTGTVVEEWSAQGTGNFPSWWYATEHDEGHVTFPMDQHYGVAGAWDLQVSSLPYSGEYCFNAELKVFDTTYGAFFFVNEDGPVCFDVVLNTGGNTTVDTDGDGVFDQDDLCPNTTAGVVVDEDGCEVTTAPTDSDGDGVLDADDLCPNTPAGTTVDATGCEESDPVDPVNTAPEVDNVSITPLLPEIGDVLTCSYSASDAENDALTATIVWMVNETVIQAGSNTLSIGFAVGDTVSCVVTVNDGSVSSSPSTATTVILPEGTNDVIEDATEGGLLPSVGTLGTLLAIAFGVGLTRRQDD